MKLRSAIPLALLLLVQSASAQVGHDPSSSPYRTLRYGQFMSLTGGYFNGTGGQIGIAPHQGSTIGFRYEFLGASTVSLGLSATYADLKRLIVNKDKPIETGVTGPFKQGTTLLEAILQFNLTGGKTWHGVAPFVSNGFGIVVSASTPADSSGFKFRTKAAITPGIGTRIFLGERLFLRLEARTTFWQLSYPLVYRSPPSSDGTKPPVIKGGSKEWVTNGWYTIGLSYAFHRPF
jgi:hypothetical protein